MSLNHGEVIVLLLPRWSCFSGEEEQDQEWKIPELRLRARHAMDSNVHILLPSAKLCHVGEIQPSLHVTRMGPISDSSPGLSLLDSGRLQTNSVLVGFSGDGDSLSKMHLAICSHLRTFLLVYVDCRQPAEFSHFTHY